MIITNLFIFISISFLFFILICKFSYKLNLVDIPNKRKIHKTPVAYTGGIALALTFVLSVYLFDFNHTKMNLIFTIGFLMAFVGFIDDKYNLNIGSKLSLQIIPVVYLIIMEKFHLSHLGEYGFFQLQLNTFAIPFTLISVLFLINAYNYFDGLNGTLTFSSISVILILYFLVENENIRLFFIIILITKLIFLLFNFSIFKLQRLFLGDSGSMLLGFITSFILIYLANEKKIDPILLAFSISIFVYEFLSINFIRLSKKKHLFTAGKDHLHHIVYKKYNSVILTNLIIFTLNIIFFIFGYLSFKLINSLSALILFIIFFFIYYSIRKKY